MHYQSHLIQIGKKAKWPLKQLNPFYYPLGVPGIYIHSLLGSRNDHEGVNETGRYRSINREKLNRYELEKEILEEGSLRNLIFTEL